MGRRPGLFFAPLGGGFGSSPDGAPFFLFGAGHAAPAAKTLLAGANHSRPPRLWTYPGPGRKQPVPSGFTFRPGISGLFFLRGLVATTDRAECKADHQARVVHRRRRAAGLTDIACRLFLVELLVARIRTPCPNLIAFMLAFQAAANYKWITSESGRIPSSFVGCSYGTSLLAVRTSAPDSGVVF